MTRQYLLDTNILSDIIRHPRGHPATHIRRIGTQQVCTSIIIAAELRFGAAKSDARRLWDRVTALLGTLDVVAFEEPADTSYAQLRAQLERAGQMIGANDMLIAAYALTLGLTLVTDNEREFSRVPGLRIENWLR